MSNNPTILITNPNGTNITWSGPVSTGNTNKYSGTDASGLNYTQVNTFNSSGNIVAISYIYESALSTNQASGMTEYLIKNYKIYSVSQGVATLEAQYSITYFANNFTALTGSASDPSGSQLTHDVSGNQLYSFNYIYTYKPYTVSSGNATVDSSSNWLYFPDASGNTQIASEFVPFESFLVNPNGGVMNFELLYDSSANILVDASGNNGLFKGIFTNMIVNVSDPSGNYYLAASVNYDPSGLVSYNLVNVSPSTPDATNSSAGLESSIFGFFVDLSGNEITLIAPNGNIYHPTTYVWQYADITVNGDASVSFVGPVIVELMTVLQEVVDDNVDATIQSIQDIITSINSSTFQFGNYQDYAELISEVNTYTSNLNNAKVNLNLEQITYLEQYASNVQSMTNLFGQMVIQLQSAQLVDTTTITQRMLTALTTISDGLNNLKAFKLAIAQQNLLKISSAFTNIANSITALYGGVTSIPNNNVSVPALLLLQESLWYFVNGENPTKDGSGNWVLWSNSNIPVYADFWKNKFGLSQQDRNDLNGALNLIKSLNLNVNNNIQIALNSPEIVGLKNSLQGFQALNSGLQGAELALVNKLASIGFKVQLRPAF